MVQTRLVSPLQLQEYDSERPSHSTPVPNPVRDLPHLSERETRVFALTRGHGQQERRGAIVTARNIEWTAVGALVAGLLGFALGAVLGACPDGSAGTFDRAREANGVVVASAGGACGHAGLRARMCALASQGSFVAQLGH